MDTENTSAEKVDPEQLLDTDSAAVMLGISPRTLQGWVRQRRIPYVKMGEGRTGLTRFRPADLREWIEARVVVTQGEAVIGGNHA